MHPRIIQYFKNSWLWLCTGALHGAPLTDLQESPYGFAFFDVGITQEDLADFRSMDIQKEHIYHQFGELETIQSWAADFFSTMGANDPETTQRAAARVAQIAHTVMQTSGKETAWLHLHSFIPTDRYDLPRWHLDGYFYPPDGPEDLLFKFAITFVGPTTLFYRLPPELRKTAERHMLDRPYMKNFCRTENIATPNIGEGALFIGGQRSKTAALHSEPPIHENRLFFSIVPCKETQLAALKTRVASVYPKDSRE